MFISICLLLTRDLSCLLVSSFVNIWRLNPLWPLEYGPRSPTLLLAVDLLLLLIQMIYCLPPAVVFNAYV